MAFISGLVAFYSISAFVSGLASFSGFMAEIVQNVVNEAAAAARAAAEAARSMEAMMKQRDDKPRFAEAGKVVRMPDPFGSDSGDLESDQNRWSEFSLAFRSWLIYADDKFERELDTIENNTKTYIAMTSMNEAESGRSKQLYSILAGLLKGRPLRILQSVTDRNGLEVWRQLNIQFAPRTKGRAISILSAYMNYPQFDKNKSCLENIQLLERVRGEYRKASNVELADDIQLSVLVRCLPRHVQQHVQLQMKEESTYAEVRAAVLAYENVTQSWTDKRIFNELGVVQSYAAGSGGSAPMEIDAVQWKGKDGGKQKGKGKDFQKGKGFGKFFNAKGKGKGKSDSKGGHLGKGKGWNQQPNAQKFDGYCDYCHKYGHKQKDCFIKKRDQSKSSGKGGNVRQVEEAADDTRSQSTSATAYRTPSVAASSTANTSKPSVKLLTQVNDELESWGDHDIEFDLTSFGQAGGAVQMVQFHGINDDADSELCDAYMVRSAADCFDMTYADSDDDWLFSPDLHLHSNKLHVRMVSGQEEIVFDSGADVSALPLRFSDVGVPGSPNPNLYVDAQGNPINVTGTRLARVRFGNVSFRENFIISPVTTPLICMGHLLRAGWGVENDGHRQWLVKGKHFIPVELRGNSVVGRGQICVLQDACADQFSECPQQQSQPDRFHVNAVKLYPVLEMLRPGWNRIHDQMYVLRCNAPQFQDSTLAPSPTEMMWYRTTLALCEGVWNVLEDGVDVTDIDDLNAPILDLGVTEVITIAHNQRVDYKFLGFDEIDDESGGEEQQQHGGPSSGSGAVPVPMDDSLPAADGEAEQPPAEREELSDPLSVTVEGVVLDSNTPLRVIRAACTNLGLTKNGSKLKCLKRLHNFISSQELMAQTAATTAVRGELERRPVFASIPEEPTPEEIASHELTHQPFQAWCEFCVANRARQDPHLPSKRVSSASIVSFDFGYVTRLEGERDKLTILFIHDQHSKMMHAVPTEHKGGKSMSYLCTETTRFVLHLGHRDVIIRADNEPSTVSLGNAVIKALRAFGVGCKPEFTAFGNHQANGGAESTVNVLRQLAMTFLQRVEHGCGLDKPVFGALHPFTAWSLVHAAWVHNRYVVTQGQTSFERIFDAPYSGKICCFGETVMAYVKTTRKGAPTWLKGVWLSKTLNHDAHIISVDNSIVCTRSVRRLNNRWNADRCGGVELGPWSFGLASLGSQLVNAKRVVEPKVMTYPMMGPSFGEAASDPPSPQEIQEQDIPEFPSMAGQPAQAGQTMVDGRDTELFDEDEELIPDGPPNPALGPQPPGPIIVQRDPIEIAASRQPPISRDVDIQDAERRDVALETNPRPAKQLKIDALSSYNVLSLFGMEHEDEPNTTWFEEDDIDMMEEYDYMLEDESECPNFGALGEDGEISTADFEANIDKLCKPFSKHEPELTNDELAELDMLADQVEIGRLKSMGVLVQVEDLQLAPGQKPKELSTKFVRTWRDKVVKGNRVWLRRARYVAREFAWLTPDREDLFSPASSSIITRVLPYAFLKRKSSSMKQQMMISMDVADAFLTVRQETPTVVTCISSNGATEKFGLGRVLPGQRDGSLLWYKDITRVLQEQLQIEAFAASPCLLRSPGMEVLILLHVDDMLLVGDKDFLEGKLIPILSGLYKLSIEKMFHAGDEVCFLKRRHVMLSESEMVIYPHNKHFDKLFELLRIRKSWKPKNTPCHGQINDIDETEELDQDNASRFRSGVGVLLYLSHDLIECQFCIRCLARYMSKPTQRSMDILKHLVCYLLGRVEYGLLLSLHELDRTSEGITLFVYSDSDWAGHRGTRKSGSSCCIQVDGVTLHAAARTQGLLALSSAEAETYASGSSACDGIFMKRVLQFILHIDIMLKLLIDNSAARQVLSRSGVGKIRHLSLKVLWLQSHVESKLITISPVASAENLADIGTKRLAVHTMKFLMHGIGIFDGSERVGEFENTNYLQKKTLKLLSKSKTGVNSNVMTLTLLSSLLGNALSCDVVAMDSGPVVAGWTLTDYAFGVVELYVWQLIVLLAVVVGSFTWMVCELNGYKASLKSWSELTDDLADDEEEKRKDAYARYLRWKRQKDAQRRWLPTIFAGVFEQSLHGGGMISSDGGTNVSTESSTQTDDLEAMEVDEGELEADKLARYRNSPLDECSDTELWFQLNHHEDLPSEASADDRLEADLEDMNARRRRAIDAITRQIDASYVSGASQEELWDLEDALNRVYML